MAITINDMMSKTLETIQEAAKKMKEKDVVSLLVIDNQTNQKA